MKKMILLLFATGALSTVFAQDGRYRSERDNARETVLGRDDHRTVYNNTPRRDDYNFDYRRKQEEIDRVTRDYNQRIAAVENDWHLRRKEKSREIKHLQKDKEQAIRDINAKYERRR